MAGNSFNYSDIRFADIQMLRYRLHGFDGLSLRQRQYVYCLSQATLYGRDITFDQFGKYNLKIRKTLEAIYTDGALEHGDKEFAALEEYLMRVWFSNGIYHHYGCDKFVPGFSKEYFRAAMNAVDKSSLPLGDGMTVDDLCNELAPVMFDRDVLAKG